MLHVADMRNVANDNRPLLDRHPRLLIPAQDRDCNRDRRHDDKREEDADEDAGSELAAIERRVKFLNWIEFALWKKRAVANDDRQVWLDAGRSGASR
jgi:hypothetical protein